MRGVRKYFEVSGERSFVDANCKLGIYRWSVYGCKQITKNDYVIFYIFKNHRWPLPSYFCFFFFLKNSGKKKLSWFECIYLFSLWRYWSTTKSSRTHKRRKKRNKCPIIYKMNNKSLDYWGVAQWHCFVEEALNSPWKPLVCQPTQHDSIIYTTS